MNKTNLSKVS